MSTLTTVVDQFILGTVNHIQNIESKYVPLIVDVPPLYVL